MWLLVFLHELQQPHSKWSFTSFVSPGSLDIWELQTPNIFLEKVYSPSLTVSGKWKPRVFRTISPKTSPKVSGCHENYKPMCRSLWGWWVHMTLFKKVEKVTSKEMKRSRRMGHHLECIASLVVFSPAPSKNICSSNWIISRRFGWKYDKNIWVATT